MRSDWEIEHSGRFAKEQAAAQPVALPPAPRTADLLPFDAGAATGFDFYVDRRSLSVSADGIVRYTLVAQSPEGARNVTHESMSCHEAEVLVHATGRPDGSWSELEPRWRRLSGPWHRALHREYFCPKGIPVVSAAEAADALAQGAHPLAQPPNHMSGAGD